MSKTSDLQAMADELGESYTAYTKAKKVVAKFEKRATEFKDILKAMRNTNKVGKKIIRGQNWQIDCLFEPYSVVDITKLRLDHPKLVAPYTHESCKASLYIKAKEGVP